MQDALRKAASATAGAALALSAFTSPALTISNRFCAGRVHGSGDSDMLITN